MSTTENISSYDIRQHRSESKYRSLRAQMFPRNYRPAVVYRKLLVSACRSLEPWAASLQTEFKVICQWCDKCSRILFGACQSLISDIRTTTFRKIFYFHIHVERMERNLYPFGVLDRTILIPWILERDKFPKCSLYLQNVEQRIRSKIIVIKVNSP